MTHIFWCYIIILLYSKSEYNVESHLSEPPLYNPLLSELQLAYLNVLRSLMVYKYICLWMICYGSKQSATDLSWSKYQILDDIDIISSLQNQSGDEESEENSNEESIS